MYPKPPYILLIAGFLAAIASGSAFSAILQQSTQSWVKKRGTESLEAIVQSSSLRVPYLGICIGTCVFLASGVQFFGFSAKVAYALGALLTALMALLVWRQLKVILSQIQAGGSKALDLDGL